MIKRTLIAISVIALLASATPTFAVAGDIDTYPPFAVYDFPQNHDDQAIKVDGTAHVFWPFEYKWLEICKIPVKMKVGMFVRVIDCDKKKLVLNQKDCKDGKIGKNDDQWPCYWGDVAMDIIANFRAQIRGVFAKNTASNDVFDLNKVSVTATPDVIEPTVKTEVVISMKAWEVKIEKIAHGETDDELEVGTISVQARPKV